MDPGGGMEFWNSIVFVGGAPGKARQQNAAATNRRHDFNQAEQGAHEILRQARFFTATINRLTNPNENIRVAVRGCEPAGNPSNADLGSMFWSCLNFSRTAHLF
jgi:hypothetical protein